jgi:4-hydroxy-tetrahydrodipicolinate synthase
MRKMEIEKIKGVIPAMITPLDKNEEIDEKGLRYLTRFLIESRVDALFPLGSIGEGPKFNRGERKKVIKIVIDEANGKVPIIPGTGGVSTRDTIEFTKDAKDLGAIAAVINPPWYFPPTDDALLMHYKTIAEKTDFPIILYNIPSLVGYKINSNVVSEAAKVENIIGVKDSTAELLNYQQIINTTPKNFKVIQGYGSLFLPSLIIGGKATMCGEANIAPKTIVNMYKSFLNGDLKAAKKLHYKLVPLASIIGLGTFPAAVKEAMNMLGLPGGYVRAPTAPLRREERDKVRNVLKNIGLNG